MEFEVSNEDEIILSTWIYKCFVAGELDMIVKWEEVDKRTLDNMVKVGLYCIQDEPTLCPSMKSVLLMLEGNIADISFPLCPASTFIFPPIFLTWKGCVFNPLSSIDEAIFNWPITEIHWAKNLWELDSKSSTWDELKDFISTIQRYENPNVLYLKGVELAFELETDYPAGERMIMNASQLQCSRAIYTKCMLNMLKDEVDSEVDEAFTRGLRRFLRNGNPKIMFLRGFEGLLTHPSDNHQWAAFSREITTASDEGSFRGAYAACIVRVPEGGDIFPTLHILYSHRVVLSLPDFRRMRLEVLKIFETNYHRWAPNFFEYAYILPRSYMRPEGCYNPDPRGDWHDTWDDPWVVPRFNLRIDWFNDDGSLEIFSDEDGFSDIDEVDQDNPSQIWE
ncbi:G-type lectin S-receptor-like serine/threonine-protein kinase RLK1 [Morella rubra]|uniref:G-type lectin S-receptor-like serine/threonine-protein kinase RLK1 n=1 Tax=Morella rubra TaxID=262757 RepID=A0A6A1WDY4_9ROSI|nr:G-type lectin S-receptor-like serine/threonine-protein kinase RLK1 [Morella rubra]